MMYVVTVLTVFGLWALSLAGLLTWVKRESTALLLAFLVSVAVILVLVYLHFELPR